MTPGKAEAQDYQQSRRAGSRDQTISDQERRQLYRDFSEPRMLRDFQMKRARIENPKIRCRCIEAIHSGLLWVRPR